MERRYNYISDYYKKIFGERTLKICIDGGFTCPNRDGNVATGGCIFCSEKGSGELIKNNEFISNNIGSIDSVCQNISNQVKQYFKTYRAERANKFIVYFQNYTNTYDSIENLKRKYDSALIDDRIVGISIATRPDCIDEEIAKLISSYTKKYHACVELGLQTANDEIRYKFAEQLELFSEDISKQLIDLPLLDAEQEYIDYIEDAFGYQYQASIYNGSVEYGLAVLKFTSPYDDANIIGITPAIASLSGI